MKNSEQKYKEALERAKIAYKDEDRHLKASLERIFPELKVSEDERIRNRLIEFISCNPGVISDLDEEKALDWLEKQGEQKPANLPKGVLFFLDYDEKLPVGDYYPKDCGNGV